MPETTDRHSSWYKETFTCEGLHYTWPGLIKAMGLILLGFFTYTITLAFVPAVMPLKLAALGANNKMIVLIMSTIGQIFNITVCPMVSFQSDRYRSKRWGRRIPFILFTMPMMIAAWVLFAFADSEAAALSSMLSRWCTVAPTTMAVVLIALIMVLYQFFLMYVGSVIYYIYNDTIPTRFLSRIAGLVTVVSSCAGMIFNFFIFRHGMTHYTEILLGTAVFYTLGIGTMCFFLKEPRFPDPQPVAGGKRGLRAKAAGIGSFFAESFSHRFYWFNFLATGCLAVSSCPNVFGTFFYLEMGLDLADIGNMNGAMGLFAAGISFLVALVGTIWIDRWHPMRVFIVCLMFDLLFYVEQCKWIFFTPPARVFWLVCLLLTLCFNTQANFRNMASMPMLMRIFPKSRFGQFCSAQSMLRSGMVLLFGLVFGAVVDFLKYNLELGNYAYRFNYVWNVFWFVLAITFYIFAYREYLKLGGFSRYRAPAPWAESGSEAMDATPVFGPNRRLLGAALHLVDVAMLLPAATAVCGCLLAPDRGVPREAGKFLTIALPMAAALFGLWLFVRHGIRRDVRRVLRGEVPKNGIPHHGLLFLAGGTETAYALASAVQSYLVLTPESTASAAWMLFYECAVGMVFPTLIFIYTRFERGASTRLD